MHKLDGWIKKCTTLGRQQNIVDGFAIFDSKSSTQKCVTLKK